MRIILLIIMAIMSSLCETNITYFEKEAADVKLFNLSTEFLNTSTELSWNNTLFKKPLFMLAQEISQLFNMSTEFSNTSTELSWNNTLFKEMDFMLTREILQLFNKQRAEFFSTEHGARKSNPTVFTSNPNKWTEYSVYHGFVCDPKKYEFLSKRSLLSKYARTDNYILYYFYDQKGCQGQQISGRYKPKGCKTISSRRLKSGRLFNHGVRTLEVFFSHHHNCRGGKAVIVGPGQFSKCLNRSLYAIKARWM